MARRPDHAAAADLGSRVSAAVAAHPTIQTPADLTREVQKVAIQRGYDLITSQNQMAKVLAGLVNPRSAALDLLAALLEALDLPPDGLGPVAEGRMTLVAAVLSDRRRPSGRTQAGRATRRYKGPPKVRSHPVAA